MLTLKGTDLIRLNDTFSVICQLHSFRFVIFQLDNISFH